MSRCRPLFALASALAALCLPLEATNLYAQPAAKPTAAPASTASAPQPSASAPSASAPQPSTSAPQPSASAPQPSASAPQPSASAPQPSGALGNPHGSPGTSAAPLRLQTGSPFASERHVQQALVARTGRAFQHASRIEDLEQLPDGTIGAILRDAAGRPLANHDVRLSIVRESIREGDRASELLGKTDSEGRVGFLEQPNDSAYRYELSAAYEGATYKSGSFRLKPKGGVFVGMTLYPTTRLMDDSFIVSRALYVIEPRNEVFQIQVLFRLYNTNPITWLPTDFDIPLPAGALAFRPMQNTGDIELRSNDHGGVLVQGTLIPGEHELSFSFQLPNPGEASATLTLPAMPNTTDARVFLESSKAMHLVVKGFEAAKPTTGNNGQAALLAQKDFLTPPERGPDSYQAQISGLPTRGNGSLISTGLAGLIVLLGLLIAREKPKKGVADENTRRARELILEELVAVEAAAKAQSIGPKTYERTRRLLLDSLGRLGA